MSAASVDRPYFRLQAAGPGSGARPQRLSLPDLRGLVQAGQHHGPLAQRGKALATHRHRDKAPPSVFDLPRGSNNFPAGIRPGMRSSSENIHIVHLSINYCVTQTELVRQSGRAADSLSLPRVQRHVAIFTSALSNRLISVRIMQRQFFLTATSLSQTSCIFSHLNRSMSQIELIDQSEVTRSIDEVVNPLVLN